MFDTSQWAFVDPLTIEQAACLWANVDPSSHWKYIADSKSRVEPFFQLLVGGFRTGELPSDPKNTLEVIGDYRRTNVAREALRAFATKRSLRPSFLFDTVMPNNVGPEPVPSKPHDQGKSLGGRPPEYDWDAMHGEILRIAHEDRLPEKQAELTSQLLSWFAHHFGTEPSESNVKQRVSEFYRHWRSAKDMKVRNPPG